MSGGKKKESTAQQAVRWEGCPRLGGSLMPTVGIAPKWRDVRRFAFEARTEYVLTSK